MNKTLIAALDFPRQPLRAGFVGALIILGVATSWRVLAETHISVIIQISILAVYILVVAKSLYGAWELGDIMGRGLCALGTAGMLCVALVYQHDGQPIGPSVVYPYVLAGGAAAAFFVLGLWLTRPTTAPISDAMLRAMAQEQPEFAAFHHDTLAASLAEVETVRRRTERDYWKLSAFGVPVAAGTGLIVIITGLAGRPPEWLFSISALALLLCSIGAAILRWKPSAARREEILRELGGHLGLTYHFGGGEAPDHRTATVFGSAHHARVLGLLSHYRELKLGAAYRGSRRGQHFVFGEVMTIPPRQLGKNTARMGRNFLLLVLDRPETIDHCTIGYEDRGLFGHRDFEPAVARDQTLSLDNGDFAQCFDIFTDDSMEARGQLTPEFMAAMMDLRHSLPLAQVPRFAFDEGQFLLAIEAPQAWLDLDPAAAMALNDPRHAAEIMARLQIILHIVDSLKPPADR